MSTSEPGPGQAPVCPRHPDWVAYVTCQRCERPTCPACQVPSAVGIHCVDCAGGGRAGGGARRTGRGSGKAAARTEGVLSRPHLLTEALIGTCVVVMVVSMALPAVTSELAFVPALALSEPWRFITTAFLHAGLMHLTFNMWALWVFGTYLEQLLGRGRFATLYGLSALGGSTAVYLFASPTSLSWISGTVGASGAIFGLFAALFVFQRRFGRDTTSLMMVIAANLAITVLSPGISWQAHLGGLVTGAAVGAVMAGLPQGRAAGRGRRRRVTLLGSVAVAAVLVAFIAAKAVLV